jgi:hypothetical protein
MEEKFQNFVRNINNEMWIQYGSFNVAGNIPEELTLREPCQNRHVLQTRRFFVSASEHFTFHTRPMLGSFIGRVCTHFRTLTVGEPFQGKEQVKKQKGNLVMDVLIRSSCTAAVPTHHACRQC